MSRAVMPIPISTKILSVPAGYEFIHDGGLRQSCLGNDRLIDFEVGTTPEPVES
jgi:hypothetical protein